MAKEFYSIETTLFDGSQFDEDEEVKYYQEYINAEEAFDSKTSYMYHQFETGYDSDEILINEDILIDGTRVRTISAENLAGGIDICKIKLRKLTMED